MARKLNLDGSSPHIPQRKLDVGKRTVSIDPRLEIGAMGTLGLPSYAYKLLPIVRIADEYVEGDRAMEKPVVIVKGTIVSLLTDQTTVDDYGMVEPDASGVVPYTKSEIDGDVRETSIDSGYWGYQSSVISLLVPANGGDESSHEYTSLDDEFGAWTESTDSDLVLGANLPAGVVYHDVYMDIRGAELNYELQDVVGVAHEGFMDIPFVDTEKVSNFGDDENIGTDPANKGYDAVYKKYAFYAFDSNANEGKSGQFLKSDRFGRFVNEYDNGSLATDRTVQTVGRILATDSRFPKSLEDEIQTYPGLKTPSSQTKGLPTDLYLFVEDVLKATDQNYAPSDVLNAVQSGAFGYARIKLDV